MASCLAGEGYRERRNAKEKTFRGSSDGARADRVVAHIRAVVDPRNHHVRQTLEKARNSKVDTVRRRSVHVQEAVRRLAHRQRAIQRERVAGAAAVPFGRYNGNFAKRCETFGERGEPGREITVVVGKEDPHQRAREIMKYRILSRGRRAGCLFAHLRCNQEGSETTGASRQYDRRPDGAGYRVEGHAWVSHPTLYRWVKSPTSPPG